MHKSHALREVWRRYANRLEPFFLPAYAPQLNLIERLWRYVKQKLACHRWWNDLDRLLQATAALLANLEVHFHAPDGLAFRPAQNFCQAAKWCIRQVAGRIEAPEGGAQCPS